MALFKNQLVSIVLLILIVLAVGNMVRTCKPDEGSTLDVQNLGGLGGYAGQKIHEFLGADKRVALILFDESAATIYGKDQYALEEQLKLYRYKIVGKKEIPAGPLFSNPETVYIGVLPMADYQRFASEHAKADAIVSFVGPPALETDEAPGPEEGAPALIIANPNVIDEALTWEQLKSGFVAMAILPRVDSEIPEGMGSGVVSLFEGYYEVVTQETMKDY